MIYVDTSAFKDAQALSLVVAIFQTVLCHIFNVDIKIHGVHARIQEFSSGGGRGPGQSDKKGFDNVFFLFFFCFF